MSYELDLDTFFNSPLGMDFDGKGLTLFPVQKFVLKLMLGLPLDKVVRQIIIPNNPLESSQGTWKYTEEEFLDYLIQDNRAHPCLKHTIPSNIVLIAGRRSTKSHLTSCMMLYKTAQALMRSEPFDGIVDMFHLNAGQSLASLQLKSLHQSLDRTWLDPLIVPKYVTNSSVSFERYGRQVRLNYASSVPGRLLGRRASFVALEEAAVIRDLTQVYHEILPSLRKSDPTTFLITSTEYSKELNDIYQRACIQEDSLALCLHTWELNPTLTCDFYKDLQARWGGSFPKEFQANPLYWSAP